MSSATLPTVARWIFLKSEPDTVPRHDSQCPWYSHCPSAWQLATAHFVSLAVTISFPPCFATQNFGQLFKYTILYPPFLSFAHNVLSPWLSVHIPFFSWPSLYILQVCKTQCKMKMWSTLSKTMKKFTVVIAGHSTKHKALLKVELCTDHTARKPALPSGNLGTLPNSHPRLLGAHPDFQSSLSLNRP